MTNYQGSSFTTIGRTERKKKEYKCDICFEIFNNMTTLTWHISRFHKLHAIKWKQKWNKKSSKTCQENNFQKPDPIFNTSNVAPDFALSSNIDSHSITESTRLSPTVTAAYRKTFNC